MYGCEYYIPPIHFYPHAHAYTCTHIMFIHIYSYLYPCPYPYSYIPISISIPKRSADDGLQSHQSQSEEGAHSGAAGTHMVWCVAWGVGYVQYKLI
ncbi:hypothetical protein EON63_16425 [archaeon]|nr:MAG: hypothetical protein EON63_16425 [archaeon]